MPGYTVLVCPTCGGKTSLEEGTPLATCMYCGNQLILRPAAGERLPSSPPPAAVGRGDAPMPANVLLDTAGEGMTITRRWFSPRHIFLGVFSLFWMGFLVFWYGMAFSVGAPLIAILFPLLHLAVGVYLGYSALAGFINTSVIKVTHNQFSVTHGPLPWPGNLNLAAGELEQLYTTEVTRRTKNGTSTSYSLCAVMRGGRKIDLLKQVDTPDTCFFIEQQVEQYLRIDDRAVAGEMPR